MAWCTTTLFLALASIITLTNGECDEGCSTPTLIYDDLKCIPEFYPPNNCCPTQYDCSHIYNRPDGTCHLRGKFYKPGDKADAEDTKGNCHRECRCDESLEFKCPLLMDGCPESWTGRWPEPGCYLTYELNRCCAAGQICPPFENTIQCDVDGETHKEGEKFSHPKQKCTSCVCHKGFDGKLERPFCQKNNCTTEIENSKHIDNYCAPLYRNSDSCCPDKWVCPTEVGSYIPASARSIASNLHCTFGEKYMAIGEKYEHEDDGKVSCECIIPPYLTCTALP